MKKTIDNVVYIMKNFYWTQLKFLLVLSGILIMAITMFSFWHNWSLNKSAMIFYHNLFSGTLINDILLWVIIDVIPFSAVYKQICQEKATNTLGVVTTGITLFTGIFMGFDIVWLGYFWKKYFVNMLIVGIRLLVPMLLISKINCSNPDECCPKKMDCTPKSVNKKIPTSAKKSPNNDKKMPNKTVGKNTNNKTMGKTVTVKKK
jgi:hypothetical protein